MGCTLYEAALKNVSFNEVVGLHMITKQHVVGLNVEVHPIVFYKIMNAIGDICERTYHYLFFYGANKFLVI